MRQAARQSPARNRLAALPTLADVVQDSSDARRPAPPRPLAAAPAPGAPGREAASASGRAPWTAAELVAALWREASPNLQATDAQQPSTDVVDLRAVLARVSTDAEVFAVRAGDAERPTVHLLAQTARAAYAALDGPSASRSGAITGSGTLPSAARLRLARMEQWLSARAATDSNAEPSANLCLWILDHLECDPQ